MSGQQAQVTAKRAERESSMNQEVVLYELNNGVATLTLNRPERRNAWTVEMQERYFWLLAHCDDDPEVRAIVVTGAGDSFCVGADTEALQVYTKTGDFDPESEKIEQSDTYPMFVNKPMVAAINGRCAGFGLVQTLMCDVRIASSGSNMSTAFARRGLPALHGIAWLLPRLIGTARATELILSGRTFTTDEAGEIGLMHRVVEPASTLQVAQDYAADLAASCSPWSMANMKQQLLASDRQTFVEAVDDAHGREAIALDSNDFKEGVMSFVERRPASFGPLDPTNIP